MKKLFAVVFLGLTLCGIFGYVGSEDGKVAYNEGPGPMSVQTVFVASAEIGPGPMNVTNA